MTRDKYLKKLMQVQRNKPKNKQTGNPSKYPQGFFNKKKCKHCGTEFIPKAPSELYCSEFCKSYAETESYYKRVYDLSINEYLDIAEKQNFKCAICGKENFAMKACSSGTLVVDHDHTTGDIRGLLCHNCNRALGLMNDDINSLKKALLYLERVTTSRKTYTQASGSGSTLDK